MLFDCNDHTLKLQLEYTEQEKIVLPEYGEGGWVDTHPSSDTLIEGSATAEMSSEEKVKNRLI